MRAARFHLRRLLVVAHERVGLRVPDVVFLRAGLADPPRLDPLEAAGALNRGIRSVAPGREINVIGRAIESYARRFGYGVVRDFTGHGIGRSFHSGLIIPHYDAAPSYDTVIEPGMTFTIEPMLNLGSEEWDMWADDWTVVTVDGKAVSVQIGMNLTIVGSKDAER